MKIYAVRDRLIDYFMTPFVAHEDKQVLATVADTINQEGMSGIQQAPHHYEIWRLGGVSEEGNVYIDKEFLADCGTLVRPRRESAGARADAVTQALQQRKTAPAGTRSPAAAQADVLAQAGNGKPKSAEEAPQTAGGGYPGGRGNGEVGGYPFA
ncbi:MAG: nonstructural protein [Microvirus sp.]|nr:MAG: nonstructural protein [Microvirus sp.]